MIEMHQWDSNRPLVEHLRQAASQPLLHMYIVLDYVIRTETSRFTDSRARIQIGNK